MSHTYQGFGDWTDVCRCFVADDFSHLSVVDIVGLFPKPDQILLAYWDSSWVSGEWVWIVYKKRLTYYSIILELDADEKFTGLFKPERYTKPAFKKYLKKMVKDNWNSIDNPTPELIKYVLRKVRDAK